jgi:hypothetical protein
MSYLGDFPLNSTFDFKFNTHKADGTPITLAGTPVISVYKDNSTTQTTTGPTLTVDFDSLTGLHNVRMVCTDAFYATGCCYQAVITTGTVDSVSVIGTVVAEWSIEKRSALRPTTAGRTLDVAATGEAGLDFDNIHAASGATTLTNITVPITTAVTNAVTISNGTGTGQLDFTSGVVKANAVQILGTAVSAPATAGILDVNLKNIANAAVSTTTAQLGVNAVQISGDATAADNCESFFDGTGYAGTNNVIPTTTTVTNAVLVSAGTGAGQLDFTSGVLKCNLVQILGTALTETASYLAAGFKKFFNIETPVLTVASVNQTGDAYAKVDTEVGTLQTDVTAIKAKTDMFPVIWYSP